MSSHAYFHCVALPTYMCFAHVHTALITHVNAFLLYRARSYNPMIRVLNKQNFNTHIYAACFTTHTRYYAALFTNFNLSSLVLPCRSPAGTIDTCFFYAACFNLAGSRRQGPKAPRRGPFNHDPRGPFSARHRERRHGPAAAERHGRAAPGHSVRSAAARA